MNKNYYLILMLSLAFFSCKKESLPELPEENSPYYKIKGLVNEDLIDWNVGLNNVTITYGTGDMNGVQTYYGQINSATDGKAIKIEVIRPERFFNGAKVTLIPTDGLSFFVQKSGAIKFNFGANFSQFNYFLIKNEANDFMSMDLVNFDEYGLYNLELKFLDYSSTPFVLPVKFGFEEELINARFDCIGDGGSIVATPEKSAGKHKWFIDGNLVSEETVFIYTLQNGIYSLKHKFSDEFGNEAEYSTLVRIKNDQFYWQLKYFYEQPNQCVSNYGKVIVSFLKNGEWYNSENTLDNLKNSFSVANINTVLGQDFEPQSCMFDFDFKSSLYNDNHTDSLYLSDMIGTINIGLK